MTDAEKRHLEKIKSMGCIVCRNLGFIDKRNAPPCDAHHITDGGRRVSHMATLPLCELHHRSGRNDEQVVSRHPWRKEFERRYGTEEKLLEQTRRELAKENG